MGYVEFIYGNIYVSNPNHTLTDLKTSPHGFVNFTLKESVTPYCAIDSTIQFGVQEAGTIFVESNVGLLTLPYGGSDPFEG